MGVGLIIPDAGSGGGGALQSVTFDAYNLALPQTYDGSRHSADLSLADPQPTLPSGWSVADGYSDPNGSLVVPPGIYAVNWYWEGDIPGLDVANYIDWNAVSYTVAPPPNPNDAGYGSGSAVYPLPSGGYISTYVYSSTDPWDVYSVLTVIRLGDLA